MSKIFTALQKVEMERFRAAKPIKFYEAKSMSDETLDDIERQEEPQLPAKVYIAAFIISFLAVFALASSIFTLAKLNEHKQFTFNLRMMSEAQASQLKEVANVQQVQKEDIAIGFQRVDKVAKDSHSQFVQVASENSNLKNIVGDLNKKISLLSTEISVLKSDNAILTREQEVLHQKLLAIREKVQSIRGHVPSVRVPIEVEQKDIITSQEGT